jgi:ABC-type branched-subunit amino acid transport system substrate-binding protein
MPEGGPGAAPSRTRATRPRYGALLVAAALSLLAIVPGSAAARDRPPLRVAVALTLSGPSGNTGADVLQGVRMALEEAGPQAAGVELAVTDDGGEAEAAREVAAACRRRRCARGARTLPQHPGAGGRADLRRGRARRRRAQHRHRRDAGIFRLNLGQSRVGEAMADYLHHALAGRRAAVIHSDDGFGRPLAQGFRRGAERLGIAASFHPVSGPEQAAAAAARIAGTPGSPAVVLGMLETTAVPALRVLRRADVPGPFLATASFAYGGYARLFADEPEERAAPGFFTDGLHAASPVLFDSGNAALLAFAERFRARHDGREPSWRAVLAYDATRMLLGAWRPPCPRRRAGRHPGAPTRGARGHRRAGRPGAGLRRPERPGLVRRGARPAGGRPDGPLRPRPARIGAAAARAGGEPRPGRARRRRGGARRGGALRPPPAGGLRRHPPQRDRPGRPARARASPRTSTSGSAAAARAGEVDAGELQFPDMRRGDFDPALPAVRRDLPDGSVYRLWHVRGEFRNEFDLRRFPFDRQTWRCACSTRAPPRTASSTRSTGARPPPPPLRRPRPSCKRPTPASRRSAPARSAA